MYGYVVPDKTKIKQEEFIVYSAFYCGVCKELGRNFSQSARYTTNYDIAFFAALVFDQLDYDVEIKKEKCIGNPFKSKPIVQGNALMKRVADLNILMTYYKIKDNVDDGEKGANLARKLFKKAYLAAKSRESKLDNELEKMYTGLSRYENDNMGCIDIVADCFATMLKNCTAIVLNNSTDENALSLAYNIGKFIYLVDALDDIDEDNRDGRYNPFLTLYNDYDGRVSFINRHKDELEFLFAATVNRAIESFNCMRFHQSRGLIENIVYYGLREKVIELLQSEKKLKRPKI